MRAIALNGLQPVVEKKPARKRAPKRKRKPARSVRVTGTRFLTDILDAYRRKVSAVAERAMLERAAEGYPEGYLLGHPCDCDLCAGRNPYHAGQDRADSTWRPTGGW